VVIRYASLVGYRENVLSGLNGDLNRKVLACLFEAEVPMTRRMIELQTGIRISSICPTVDRLLKSGLIKVAYQGEDPHSGRIADFVEPVMPQPFQRSFEGFALGARG
jgi:hypothetical protein